MTAHAEHAAPRRDTVALTPTGRARLEQELTLLRHERLPALTARLAEAREDSAARDEDSGLLEAQEEHSRAERRARELERLLVMAGEIAPPGDGTVALGSRVEIAEEGLRDVVQLVDSCEANAAEGRVSRESPVGRALLGHRAGEMVVVTVPDGERCLYIVSVG